MWFQREALGPVPPQSSFCSLEQIPRGKNSDSSALPTSRLQPRRQHFCVAATLFYSCSVAFFICLQSKKHLYSLYILSFTSKNQLSCRGRRLGSEKSETCRSKGQGSTCWSQTLVLGKCTSDSHGQPPNDRDLVSALPTFRRTCMSLTSLDRTAKEGKKQYQTRGFENHLGKPTSFQLNSIVFFFSFHRYLEYVHVPTHHHESSTYVQHEEPWYQVSSASCWEAFWDCLGLSDDLEQDTAWLDNNNIWQVVHSTGDKNRQEQFFSELACSHRRSGQTQQLPRLGTKHTCREKERDSTRTLD